MGSFLLQNETNMNTEFKKRFFLSSTTIIIRRFSKLFEIVRRC